MTRMLLVLAFSLLASRAHAQEWHLALESPLVEYRSTRYDESRLHVTDVRFALMDEVGLRLGYLWSWGLELGVALDVGFVRAQSGPLITRQTRVSLAGYARYVFAGERVRPFVGVFAGETFLRVANSAELPSADAQLVPPFRDPTLGLDAGTRLRLSQHVSLDPYLRLQLTLQSRKLRGPAAPDQDGSSNGTLENERAAVMLHAREVRLLVGFALSFWL